MTVKQVVTFTIKKDLEKFKVKATEVVNITKVGIFSYEKFVPPSFIFNSVMSSRV